MLYDAVFLASDEVMRKQDGRKALVVLSDGVDTGSKESLDAAIESAQRANTVVYSILFKDDEVYEHHGGFGGPGIGFPGGGRGGHRYPEQRPDGKKVLERISKETGGRVFAVSKKEPIDQIYSQITEELRNQYNLGYTPDRTAGNDSSYHKILVAAKQKDLIVQARDGYYGDKYARMLGRGPLDLEINCAVSEQIRTRLDNVLFLFKSWRAHQSSSLVSWLSSCVILDK